MSFTQNYWSQRDTIKIYIILTKQGTDTIHDIIPKKYHKYPSTTILKHVNVLSKLNQLTYVCLQNLTPHDDYSITIHIRVMTISEIIHEKKN